MNIYLRLTADFNAGRHRAVLCSGQAAVLHRLAITSKDGDWILKEDEETLAHVLSVLERRGAVYRFGAPLDVRWMAGGWSAHLEFPEGDLRVRTDFFTRPPRVSEVELERMWSSTEGQDPPFTDARILAEMKKTDRQKDYPFIGELARRMDHPEDQLYYSRSAEDLIELTLKHPAVAREVALRRPLLTHVNEGRRALAEALQVEMLDLIELSQERLRRYAAAAVRWREAWPTIASEIESLPLTEAHARLVEHAQRLLPTHLAP